MKEIKDEIRKELAVLKDMINDLEILVEDRFQAGTSADTEELKSAVG